jgi:hypothetical protein
LFHYFTVENIADEIMPYRCAMRRHFITVYTTLLRTRHCFIPPVLSPFCRRHVTPPIIHYYICATTYVDIIYAITARCIILLLMPLRHDTIIITPDAIAATTRHITPISSLLILLDIVYASAFHMLKHCHVILITRRARIYAIAEDVILRHCAHMLLLPLLLFLPSRFFTYYHTIILARSFATIIARLTLSSPVIFELIILLSPLSIRTLYYLHAISASSGVLLRATTLP